ncbi:alpha/beta fold hydrolase [Rhizobium sp. C4]|uniref:alpha/beta fold hydrolase n=1 Tax=Rhizobium sp. C4 TaxID=1349800 RepID=UPI001E523250|nr:alpha/beta hydrolase [Rhizobium sp. C4]MCD2173594.1 alpha/beta hydrolase [Rhizobium sp. C4]
MSAPATSQTIASHVTTLPNGQTLRYVDNGAGGPVIVFLHGYTDSWRSFEPLFSLLPAAFRLIAPDQRGHGTSGRAARYSIADFTSDGIAFIEQLAVGPVHLIGHSLGSIVAQRVAEKRPDLLASLTLIGPTRTARAHPGLLEFREELKQLADPVPADFIEQFQSSTTHTPLSDTQLAVLVGESAKLDLETWRGALDGLIEEPSDFPALPADVAVLSLWGEEDAIFDREAQLALSQAAPRHTEITYPDVGHAPHWEIPSRVAEDIRDFVLTHHRPANAAKGAEKTNA